MRNELTNLLPPERQKAFSRDYVLRLTTVLALFISALTLISAALLVPTYAFLSKNASVKEGRLAAVNSVLSTADEQELSARLTALTKDAVVLAALSDTPSVSDSVRSVLSLSHPGVTLTGFSYTSAGGEKSRTLSLSGAAATREALRNYQLALEDASFILSATLPVSAYAKDANIAFTITVTFAP